MYRKIGVEFMYEALSGLYLTSVVVLFWRHTITASLLLGAGVIVVYYIMISIAIIRSIAIVYTVIMLITVIFWHEERDVLIFITGGMIGTFGEYICMQQGFWHYHFPHFISIGLPVSLPMAWGLSAIIIGRIAKIWEVDA